MSLGPRLSTIILDSLYLWLAIYPLVTFAAVVRDHSSLSPRDPPYGSSHGGSESDPEFSNLAVHGHEKRASGECTGFPGDPDTYGLGIRVGLYFQWVTSSIAYNLVPSEAINMRGVNNCFQLAMFAGLLYVTIMKGSRQELHAMEAYLMLLFCMGGVCSGSSEPDEDTEGNGKLRFGVNVTQRKGYAFLEASTLGGYVRVLLGCGFIGYGLWFVFLGMDGMHRSFPDDCNYAFFLAQVDLFGWFRTFLKVLFILSSIPALPSLLYMTFSLAKETWFFFFYEGWKGRIEKNHGQKYSPSKSETEAAPKSKQPANSEGEMRASSEGVASHRSEDKNKECPEDEKPGLQNIKVRKINVGMGGALILFILSVELIIKWNKIEGVGNIGSTGQLLPVIIGVAGIGRVLMRLISDLLEEAALRRQKMIIVLRNRKPPPKAKRPPMATGSMVNNQPTTQQEETHKGKTIDKRSSPHYVHDTEGFPFRS